MPYIHHLHNIHTLYSLYIQANGVWITEQFSKVDERIELKDAYLPNVSIFHLIILYSWTFFELHFGFVHAVVDCKYCMVVGLLNLNSTSKLLFKFYIFISPLKLLFLCFAFYFALFLLSILNFIIIRSCRYCALIRLQSFPKLCIAFTRFK